MKPMCSATRWFGAVLAMLMCGTATTATAASRADAAITSLARLFDDHALVMFGEMHRNAQQHAFLRELLRDPRFACRMDDVVIEFGNARLQSMADRYVAGADLSETQLQGLWRETVVLLAWNSPVYRRFYETVRDTNLHHRCDHPLRLVLADPPIDWKAVDSAADFARLPDRDAYFADVVEREVLARHHRALLIAGELHAVRRSPPQDDGRPADPTVAALIERRHPGVLFSIVPVPSSDAARRLDIGTPPVFMAVRGTRLEHEDFAPIAPGWKASLVVVGGRHVWKQESTERWPAMRDVVDGVLYLGGDATKLYPPPSVYADPAYMAELRRRARIIKAWNGQDFLPVLDDLARDAAREKARKTR